MAMLYLYESGEKYESEWNSDQRVNHASNLSWNHDNMMVGDGGGCGGGDKI